VEICKAKYCDNRVRSNGWCINHYYYAKNHSEAESSNHKIKHRGASKGRSDTCIYPKCEGKHYCGGYCVRHYNGIRRNNKKAQKEYKPTPDSHLDGRSSHPLRDTWYGMIDRCYNKNNRAYKRYGGRGIKVCDRWLNDFHKFIEDMPQKPLGEYSIDRENNDGDYTPDNCRWATRAEQQNNKWFSDRLTASNLAKLTGYSRERIRQLTNPTPRGGNKHPLRGFIEERFNYGQYNVYIYTSEAIQYLINKKTKNTLVRD